MLFTASTGISCSLCRFHLNGNTSQKSYIEVVHRYSGYMGYNLSVPSSQDSPTSSRNGRMEHSPSSEIQIINQNTDKTTFRAYELWGNLSIGKHLNIILVFPYEQNDIYYSRILDMSGTKSVTDSLLQYEGFGSVIAIVDYSIQKESGNALHVLRPAIGKAFSRKGTIELNQIGIQADHTIQPGAGIPEFFFRLNYNLSVSNSSFGTTILRGWSRENDMDYWFGRSVNLQVYYSRKFGFRHLELTPGFNSAFESNQPDIEYKEKVLDTGRKAVLLGININVRFKNLSVATTMQKPIYQELNGEQMMLQYQFINQLKYNF